MSRPIPYGELEVLFLDVGNTLVSMDFQWVSDELARLGIHCGPEALRRAEAAARPVFSAAYSSRLPRDADEVYEVYFRALVARLRPEEPHPEVVGALKRVLCAPGMTQRLWSWPLPGVREALEKLTDLGLRMIAVSNADGTIEQGLTERGFRGYLEAVVDSALVGYEKPDPRIFEHALALTGADPARTLHVGDMHFADVVGARRAGIHALLLDPYDDWEIDDCPRLPDLAAVAEAIGRARRAARVPP